jgi:methanethiol oxidase
MHEHDKPVSFHASPLEAMRAPAEEFLYLACLRGGTGVDKPDFLAVVDAERGEVVHETAMPSVDDELHHFGWNRCSSACHGPDRSHLIVPGFRSSRIHVVDVADDPRRPRIDKVIEPGSCSRRRATRDRTPSIACRATRSSSRCSATPTATAPAASPSSTRRPSR